MGYTTNYEHKNAEYFIMADEGNGRFKLIDFYNNTYMLRAVDNIVWCGFYQLSAIGDDYDFRPENNIFYDTWKLVMEEDE